MKKIILIILINLFYFSVQKSKAQQSAYYDVLFIHNKCFDESQNVFINPSSLFELLKKYYPNNTAITNNLIKSNPFFADYVPDGGIQSIESQLYVNNLVKSAGGIDVTNIADGLAKFLVKRTKQELSAAFFEKFKEDLNKNELADLKILFPETSKILNTIGEDIYQYSTYLNTLREGFIKDMSNQYTNLQKLLNQGKYKEYFLHTRPELGSILNTSLYFINKISTGVHPGEALANYNTSTINLCGVMEGCDPDKLKNQTNIKNSIEFLKILSASFRSTSKNNYWVPADSVKMLFQDKISYTIYMGLLYETAKDISFTKNNNSSLSLQTVLSSAKKFQDSLSKFQNYIESLSDKTQTINDQMAALKEKNKTERDYNDYYTLFNASLDLLDHTRTFVDLPYVNLDSTQEEKIRSVSSSVLFVSKSAGELYIDVKTKNYSSAIINSIMILDTLANYNYAFNLSQIEKSIEKNKVWLDDNSGLGSKSSKKIREVFTEKVILEISKKQVNYEVIKSQLPADLIKKIDNIQNIKDSLLTYVNLLVSKSVSENKQELRKSVLKYGTFIASIAQAKSGDEVEAVIESIALPSGSSRVKRESKFNVSLNAYCGLFVATEKQQFKYEEPGPVINSFGITAPIGIAFSKGGKKLLGMPCKKSGHFSHTIFMSIIDIGAVTSFRFQNDSIKTLQKIQLKDIVSPGLFYSIGIPKKPISINMGYQIAPFLNEVSASNNTTRASYHRFSISILVDIPLLNFYTKPR